MRVLFFVLLGISTSICQSAAQERNADDIVQSMLSHDSALYGGYSSWDEKELSRLGDAACVAAARFLEGKDLSITDIRTALLIIRFSFEAPTQIRSESDRQPRAASTLLDTLEKLSASSTLKEEFSVTRKALKRTARTR